MALPAVPNSLAPTVAYRPADPDRMAGQVPVYQSFADFVTQCKVDAADPGRVGAGDILDILNPLQHIPLVGSLYRHVTGDTIKPGAMLMGGAVFGGGAGLVAASVNVAVADEAGADMGEMVLARLDPPAGAVVQESPVQVARAEQTLVASYASMFKGAEVGRNESSERAEGRPAPAHIAYFDPDRTAGGVVVYV